MGAGGPELARRGKGPPGPIFRQYFWLNDFSALWVFGFSNNSAFWIRPFEFGLWFSAFRRKIKPRAPVGIPNVLKSRCWRSQCGTVLKAEIQKAKVTKGRNPLGQKTEKAKYNKNKSRIFINTQKLECFKRSKMFLAFQKYRVKLRFLTHK